MQTHKYHVIYDSESKRDREENVASKKLNDP